MFPWFLLFSLGDLIPKCLEAVCNEYQTINNYWTRLSKISWFVSGEQINNLPMPKAESNNWSARHWQITIFCDNRVQFNRVSVTYLFCVFVILLIPSHFVWENLFSDVEVTMREQSIICRETIFASYTHAQIIICTQLFCSWRSDFTGNPNWEKNKLNNNRNYISSR